MKTHLGAFEFEISDTGLNKMITLKIFLNVFIRMKKTMSSIIEEQNSFRGCQKIC